MEKRDIEIRRNIVEQSLMAAKDFARAHLRAVAYAAAGLLAAVALVIAGIVVYNSVEDKELASFELILDRYRVSAGPQGAEREARFAKTVQELEAVVRGSYWGYVHTNGYYIIGGLCYGERRYAEAGKYYLRFFEGSPRSFFAPLGLQQAARCSEQLGDLKEAARLYSLLEKKYGEGIIADQILYDMGRMRQQQGEIFKAREYYNKLIVSHPRSSFVQKARERLMLLGQGERM